MRCPYCSKNNCEPEVVCRNIETYGSNTVRFRCNHSHEKLCQLKVAWQQIRKSGYVYNLIEYAQKHGTVSSNG